MGRGRQALQRGAAARGRARRRAALQAGPSELRRVRRQARLRRRAATGPAAVPRRAHRRADLRGHVDAGRGRDSRRERRRDPARPQWQPLRGRQGRQAHGSRGRPRGRDRPAARLRQPGRRAGRDRLRRRVLRARRRPAPAPAGALVPRGRVDAALDARRGRRPRLRRGPRRGAAGRPCRDLRRARAGARRLRAQEPLSRRHPGPVGRHRFRVDRRDRGRRARRRQGPHGDDAVALHQPREPRGRGRGRAPSGRALRHDLDRARDAGLRRHARAILRRRRARHHRGEHPVARAG